MGAWEWLTKWKGSSAVVDGSSGLSGAVVSSGSVGSASLVDVSSR